MCLINLVWLLGSVCVWLQRQRELLNVSSADASSTVSVCVFVYLCLCVCVCTSWLPMCLTNNHNLATLPRSRRRHFTLPSPWRSALPHTHAALQCALQTHSLPPRCLWFLPYLALFSFNTFQRVHCTPIYLLHSAAGMAYGKTNYYTLTMRRCGLWWLGWIFRIS